MTDTPEKLPMLDFVEHEREVTVTQKVRTAVLTLDQDEAAKAIELFVRNEYRLNAATYDVYVSILDTSRTDDAATVTVTQKLL